jgi:hypothetical protein
MLKEHQPKTHETKDNRDGLFEYSHIFNRFKNRFSRVFGI